MNTQAALPRTDLRIRDLVEVRPHPTVVRLDDARADGPAWITEAYHLTADVQASLDSLRKLLSAARGSGIFVIGQYGSGKSHFLAYVARCLEAGTLIPDGPAVATLSLLHYRGETPLEDAVATALGIDGTATDRRPAWSELARRHPRGLVLLIDELSEFLRSKPDPGRFNEDIRFLQFLGEWAQVNRFWPLAAVQEQVEHLGELEHGLYRKIKDRYPIRYILSPVHVRSLVSESILGKKPGYAPAVEKLAAHVREALPGAGLDMRDFASLYPVHPATLDLLEEVRDRFSQARGIVDFTVSRLLGDPARGIPRFLDRPWGDLITPDAIVEHFQDLFEVQSEFLPLAQQVLPFYQRHIPEAFATEAARELAWKALRLLILFHLSPARDGLSAREAAHLLLFRASRIDPERNLKLVEGVLRQLHDGGRFVTRREDRYRLEPRDDGIQALEAEMEREKAELSDRGDMLFELVSEGIGRDASDAFDPLALPRDAWQRRAVRWFSHERPYSVYLGNGVPPAEPGAALCIRLPWGDAGPAPGLFTLLPARIEPGDDVLELAALLRVHARPHSREAVKRLEARLKERTALFRARVRNAYLDTTVAGPAGGGEAPPRASAAASLESWLDRHADWMLRRIYPAFEKYAPGHGPLPREAYRRFLAFAAEHDLCGPTVDEHVAVVREGYLVPMQILQRRGSEYALRGSLEKHDLVRLVLSSIERRPSPKSIHEHLAQPIYGLVPDQVNVLLLFLYILGEIDILKGKHSLRELQESFPNPLHYDAVVPGTALAPAEIDALDLLCQGLRLRTPRAWTVLEQRRAIRHLREAARKQADRLQALAFKLADVERDRAGGAEGLSGKLERAIRCWAALDRGDSDLEQFRRFLEEAGAPARFLELNEELGSLSEKIHTLASELGRLRHLMAHPAFQSAADPSLAIRAEALGNPPGIDEPAALEEWMERARTLYEEYREAYVRKHDEWWQARRNAALDWEPPQLALSRHLALDEKLEALRAARQRAARSRCRGLVNLDFQPVCACGFDGRTSPFAAEAERFGALRAEIDGALGHFLAQADVKARLSDWVAKGLDPRGGVAAYLEGRARFPSAEDLETLDRHLAGVELVREIDSRVLWEILEGRTWERSALVAAIDELLARHGAARLRFRQPAAPAPGGLAAWCAEHALRLGVPLPAGLGAAEHAAIAEALRPEWLGQAALGRLEGLGLGERALDQAVRFIIEGRVERIAAASASSLARAAFETLAPGRPSGSEELGALAEDLYRHHAIMLRAAGERWLERLDCLARSALDPAPPTLESALEREGDAQWLIIDCLGLPLLRPFLAAVPGLLPGFRLRRTGFGLVSAETTTDGCYRKLVEAGFRRAFEKVNAVDALLHARFVGFEDFARLAIAELHIAAKGLGQRLDPGVPLVVFADHGFRLAPDGRSYTHGRDSTLERVVPVLRFGPG